MFAADWAGAGVQVRRLRPALGKRALRAFIPASVLWPERDSCFPCLKDRVPSRLLSVFLGF
jgi:hypothetical protein